MESGFKATPINRDAKPYAYYFSQKISSFSRFSRLYLLKPAGLRISMAKSDEALMLQLQAGDLRSFDILVKRWEKPLLNYCYRMVNDITLAEDLRQEVFLRIYRSAKTYRPTAQFSTWMYRIGTNLCLDTLAKQQRRKETPIAAYLESESEGFDDQFVDPSDPPDMVVVKREIENSCTLGVGAFCRQISELWSHCDITTV